MPKSIKLFEQLYLGSLVLAIIQGGLVGEEIGLGGVAALGWTGFQVVGFIIAASLVLLTSRKKSVLCKWILVVFFVLELGLFMPVLGFLVIVFGLFALVPGLLVVGLLGFGLLALVFGLFTLVPGLFVLVFGAGMPPISIVLNIDLISTILEIVQILMQAYAVCLLFKLDSKNWFAAKNIGVELAGEQSG